MGCAFDKQQPSSTKPKPQDDLREAKQAKTPEVTSIPANEITAQVMNLEQRKNQQVFQPPGSPLQNIKVENNFLGSIHNPTVQKGELFKKQNHYGEIVSQETNLIYKLQFGVGMQNMPSTISI